MNNVYKIENFLSPEELAAIDNILTNEDMWAQRSDRKVDKNLGRVMYTISLPENIRKNIIQRAEAIFGKKLDGFGINFVDYDGKYGTPNLVPHFDGDNNSVIIDYQYKSNTSWGLAVNTTVFEMNDNDALIFNPNEYPHWRPHKKFEEGEFVTMIFIRFPSPETDYTHMNFVEESDGFQEAKDMLRQARKLREDLKFGGK